VRRGVIENVARSALVGIGQHGLLVLQAGPDVLRFVPPLIIADADIADGLSRLRSALHDVVSR
jgi:acetylornithine/N-succinyldiaminopimelate aminotransferase